jgi:hypothetical protein
MSPINSKAAARPLLFASISALMLRSVSHTSARASLAQN